MCKMDLLDPMSYFYTWLLYLGGPYIWTSSRNIPPNFAHTFVVSIYLPTRAHFYFVKTAQIFVKNLLVHCESTFALKRSSNVGHLLPKFCQNHFLEVKLFSYFASTMTLMVKYCTKKFWKKSKKFYTKRRLFGWF